MLKKFVKRLASAPLFLPLFSHLLLISTNAIEINRGPFNLPAELGTHILSFVSLQDLTMVRQVSPNYRDAANDLLERLPYDSVRENLRIYPFKNMSIIKFMLERNKHWKQQHINDLFIHLAKHFKADQEFKNKLPEVFIHFSSYPRQVSYMLTLAMLYRAAERYDAGINILKEARLLFPDSQEILIKSIKYIMLYGSDLQRRDLHNRQYRNPARVARSKAWLSSDCRDYSMIIEESPKTNYINLNHELGNRAECLKRAERELEAAISEEYQPAILPYLLKIPKGNIAINLDRTLEEMAKLGDPKAQYYYGLYGLEGILPMSKSKAQNYLKKAAEQGYAKAQSLLGSFYWIKSKGARDRYILQDKAALYLRIAAYKGVYIAQYNLGCIFMKKKIYHKASKIFKKLSDQNFIPNTDELISSPHYLWLDKLPARTLYAQAIYCRGDQLYRSCYFHLQHEGLDLIVQACQLNNINALLCYAQILTQQGAFEQSLHQYELILNLYEEGRAQECLSLPSAEQIVQQRAKVYMVYSEYLRNNGLAGRGTTFFYQELIKRSRAPKVLQTKNGYSPEQLNEIRLIHQILRRLSIRERILQSQQ